MSEPTTSSPPACPEVKKPNPRKLLVYIEPCTCDDKLPGAKFADITEQQLHDKRLGEKLGDLSIYGNVMLKRVSRPGTVYSVEYKEEEPGTVYGSTIRYAGFLDNDPRTVEWQASTDMFRREMQLAAREKKNSGRSAMRESLAPVKIAYNKLVGQNRQIYLAEVVAYVTGRVTKDDLKMAGYENEED